MTNSGHITNSAGVMPCAFIDDISFSYGSSKKLALNGITLELTTGDMLGIIGPSGSGKTTLASSLSGAIPHHYAGKLSGKVLIEGKDSFDLKLTDISQIVGSVLQDIDAQMIAANVEDELLFGLENFGVDKDEVYERLLWALDTVGITDLLNREIATLSGGQKQKVAIAAILALRPKVMVLDEPTAALDPASSRKVYETLVDLNKNSDITIVVIEQKVALLAEFCKHIAVMSEGKLAAYGEPETVFGDIEQLRSIGVDSPRTVRLSHALNKAGIYKDQACFLSVCDAKTKLLELIGNTQCPDDLDQRVLVDSFDYGEQKTEVVREATSHGEALLAFRDVNFSYGTGKASLKNINFEVFAGELVGIVGQNGAGKTTLTKLMNGLLKPSGGDVVICGKNTRTTPTSELAKSVSTLFQNPDHQICKNTVLEEIAFSQELLGVDPDTARREAKELCCDFNLPQDAAPFSLSCGQRQIVALASVLITKPQVLILDEPTSGLDYLECKIVMDAIELLRQAGCAVVMVCHDMEVASDFASRLIVMAEGEILFDGDKRIAFANKELMEKAYIRPPQVAELAQALVSENTLSEKLAQHLLPVTEVFDMASVISCTLAANTSFSKEV